MDDLFLARSASECSFLVKSEADGSCLPRRQDMEDVLMEEPVFPAPGEYERYRHATAKGFRDMPRHNPNRRQSPLRRARTHEEPLLRQVLLHLHWKRCEAEQRRHDGLGCHDPLGDDGLEHKTARNPGGLDARCGDGTSGMVVRAGSSVGGEPWRGEGPAELKDPGCRTEQRVLREGLKETQGDEQLEDSFELPWEQLLPCAEQPGSALECSWPLSLDGTVLGNASKAPEGPLVGLCQVKDSWPRQHLVQPQVAPSGLPAVGPLPMHWSSSTFLGEPGQLCLGSHSVSTGGSTSSQKLQEMALPLALFSEYSPGWGESHPFFMEDFEEEQMSLYLPQLELY